MSDLSAPRKISGFINNLKKAREDVAYEFPPQIAGRTVDEVAEALVGLIGKLVAAPGASMSFGDEDKSLSISKISLGDLFDEQVVWSVYVCLLIHATSSINITSATKLFMLALEGISQRK
jgi:hypothetical protein